jgi:hypothetical protein
VVGELLALECGFKQQNTGSCPQYCERRSLRSCFIDPTTLLINPGSWIHETVGADHGTRLTAESEAFFRPFRLRCRRGKEKPDARDVIMRQQFHAQASTQASACGTTAVRPMVDVT